MQASKREAASAFRALRLSGRGVVVPTGRTRSYVNCGIFAVVSQKAEPMNARPANFDPSIDPSADQVRALRDSGPDGPVVMLNLLKFRAQANYPEGSPHPPCSGAEAYRRYQTAFVETVGAVSRAEVVWEGKIDRPFIGDAGQDWDKCLLVRYPSRQHFLAMMADSAYRDALVHRYAGLERTVLLPMQG